ncbi:hypothetical protein COV89_03610 [Candidatus Shapirobacteria bacterium CG11_big_fil_rev_8_21_14_0_20_40_12]|uniref:Uncharacterized protein n=1 Tax=Candidatus Shapirobacteria bacterium CG11_big_fil_rev_8_21_14_0_20_40_12 TaxID=1974889 RepID=A0A2H0KF23_9BACT|nr:MAG: hypothetical protein COV89_03610 [Candidatus Shapirobacteria bacterium CG11_big_fil_rev_8_21_14_0_20_40_12]
MIIKGVNLLCAQGRMGQAQLLFSWRRISQSEIRKIAAAKKETAKARAGKNSFLPQPSFFLPARAEKFFRNQSPDFRQKKFGF